MDPLIRRVSNQSAEPTEGSGSDTSGDTCEATLKPRHAMYLQRVALVPVQVLLNYPPAAPSSAGR